MSEGAFPLAAYGLVADYRYGPAAPFVTRPTNFAGNANKDYVIGGTYVERPQAVSFQLVTVGAGTRFGSVAFLDEGGAVLAQAVQAFSLSAGKTSQLTFAVGLQQGGANDAAGMCCALPAMFLYPTYTVRLSVLGGLAADTASAVRIITDRFSTDPELYAPGIGQTPE